METKEILSKVRKIEIKTRRLSDHMFSGEYHSSFKGRGMTFSEVKPYAFGDDIRNIDWNVTARYNEPYVKVFEEERELVMMLVIDVSASGNFGTHQSKKEMLTEIAATLAFSAIQNNDKVGLVLFSNDIELYIPPKKGKFHVLRIIRELLEFTPKHTKTNLNHALKFLSNVLKKKAIVFLLSDFMDTSYQHNLQWVAKKNDVTGIMMYDLYDKTLPKMGLVPVVNAETATFQMINTASVKAQTVYTAQFLSYLHYFEETLQKCGAGKIICRTDQDYVSKLLLYFKQRA